MDIIDVLRKCTSWSKVEDRGEDTNDRYAVTVYFDEASDAQDFGAAIGLEVNGATASGVAAVRRR